MQERKGMEVICGELQALVDRGTRDAWIDAKELDALLDRLELDAEACEEVLRRIDSRGIRVIPPREYPGSHGNPDPEEVAAAFRRNEAVLSYLAQLPDAAPLSWQEETELGARMTRGDGAARERLVNGNLLRVVDIARKYTGWGVCALDLIQAGNDALMEAADGYDQSEGGLFSAYAENRIRRAMSQLVEDCTCVTRIPEDAVRSAVEARQEDSTSVAWMRESLLEHIREVRGEPVTPEDWALLSLRFGLDRGKPRSLEEMVALGYDREMVRRIEYRNLRRFRNVRRRRNLRNFLE